MVALALLIGAVVSMSVPVAAVTAYAPGGFRLKASNGYSIHVIAFDGDPRGELDSMILFVARKGSGATYFARKGMQDRRRSAASRASNARKVEWAT